VGERAGSISGPARCRTDILLRSHFGQNSSTFGWGLAAGVRFNFDLPGNPAGRLSP